MSSVLTTRPRLPTITCMILETEMSFSTGYQIRFKRYCSFSHQTFQTSVLKQDYRGFKITKWLSFRLGHKFYRNYFTPDSIFPHKQRISRRVYNSQSGPSTDWLVFTSYLFDGIFCCFAGIKSHKTLAVKEGNGCYWMKKNEVDFYTKGANRSLQLLLRPWPLVQICWLHNIAIQVANLSLTHLS